MVVRGHQEIFSTNSSGENLVLFLHIRFEVSKKEIDGFVALVMDIPTLEELRGLIADFIRRST